jgi:hypothetical protein
VSVEKTIERTRGLRDGVRTLREEAPDGLFACELGRVEQQLERLLREAGDVDRIEPLPSPTGETRR